MFYGNSKHEVKIQPPLIMHSIILSVRFCFLVGFILMGFCTISWSQINTPTPTIPLNSNGSYPNATILPTNAVAADATNAYNTWKTQYVDATCSGSTQARVKFDNPSETVSEGIGYGMLLAAYAGDKALLDKLWAYYKANSNGNGLMNWKINGCSGASGTNAATDADEDAAMALMVAEYQWPTLNSPYDYKTEADALVKAINKCEVDKNTTPQYQISNGDGWINCNTTANNCRNPGYLAPAYYQCWSTSSYITSAMPTAPWTTVVTTSNNLINANVTSKGLVTDWSDQNGTPNTCNGGVNGFGYDASRGPWRMATYSAWYGNTMARTICNNLATSTLAAGPANVGGPVVPATNNPTGTHNATFVSMLAAGTFGSTTGTQAHINAMYSQVLSTVDAGAGTGNPSGYFGNTLRVISIFFATKNFWNPCNVGPTIVCRQPALGADVSTCGSGFPVTLNSNTPTATNVTFTWKRITPSASTLVTASSSANTFSVTSAMGAGTYAVIRDSSGGCTHSDTIVISSTLPIPNLGTNPAALCATSSYNLTPSNVASFPGSTTWQWAVDYSGGTAFNNLTGETSSTLSNVRRAGNYQLTASISGCSSTLDAVLITSSLPTPVDGCVSGSGTTTISVTNPGLNGTNYNWYTTLGGSTLATVVSGTNTNTTSITVNVSSTTTYYVQDMSAVNTNVGPTSQLGTGTNWGINSGNHLLFTANSNFTLNSFQVPYGNIYANDPTATITIEILDGTGASFATPKVFTSDPTNVTTAMSNTLITFSFTGLNIQSAWGPNLRMRINAKTTNSDLLWSAGPASYPYNSAGGIVSITGEAGGSGANEYMYFYNWNISTGTPCSRLPVMVKTSGCTPAPVELASFYAERIDDRAILYWATAAETNNDYFSIERSVDGENFEVIGNLDGMGTKSGITLYSFADENAPLAETYYRLVQFDYDGQYERSMVVSIESENKLSGVQIVPNPFNHSTQILVSAAEDRATVQLTDLSGHIAYTGLINTNEYQNIGELLPSGVYLLQIFVGNEKIINKIVKQ